MKKKKGFTLVEILVVIAIVAILASVAYSSYDGSVKKSRRRDAQGVLQGLAQAMERHQTTTGSYKAAAVGGADIGAPNIYSDKSPIEGNQTFYDIEITVATTTSYNLAAFPAVGAQDGDGYLSLSSTGARQWDANNDGNITADEECWDC